jgi:hypothetical protein
MMMSLRLAAACALVATAAAPPPQTIFQEPGFTTRCDADGKRLWGVSLCAPIVVVDQATGQFRTSEPAPGPLPAIRANTGFAWGGRQWIMLIAPLPKDPAQRLDLIYHEAFHVHQQEIGLPPNNAVAGHLDEMRSRYLIRMEWNALAAALRAPSAAPRRKHIAQALAFRAQRLADRADAADTERQQMRHEGLAAYTGAVLSGAPVKRALRALEAGALNPSYGRSFAYASAPAWGLLLDSVRPGWRRELGSGKDLPDMVPFAAASIAQADLYDGGRILAEESAAAAKREAERRIAADATAPERALRLPLLAMHMDFDPNRVWKGKDGSTYYGRITVTDRWGRISVEGTPFRIAPDFSAAYVAWPLPEGALKPADGWTVEKGRAGGARLAATAH